MTINPNEYIIVDIDGTIADSRHRSHHIRLDVGTDLTDDHGVKMVIVEKRERHDDFPNETAYLVQYEPEEGSDAVERCWWGHATCEGWRKIDWDAWDADTLKDTNIEAAIRVIRALKATGAKVMFLTARGERARDLTTVWLNRRDLFHPQNGDVLIMRAAGDTRRDTDIKRELIESFRETGVEFTMAFEDRRLVANMLRELGIFVFHVADYD